MADNLLELATAHGFGAHVSLLRKYVLPCVGFTLDLDPNSSETIGGSRWEAAASAGIVRMAAE